MPLGADGDSGAGFGHARTHSAAYGYAYERAGVAGADVTAGSSRMVNVPYAHSGERDILLACRRRSGIFIYALTALNVAITPFLRFAAGVS